jgi:hypothetical protein
MTQLGRAQLHEAKSEALGQETTKNDQREFFFEMNTMTEGGRFDLSGFKSISASSQPSCIVVTISCAPLPFQTSCNPSNRGIKIKLLFSKCSCVASPPQLRTTERHATMLCKGKRMVQLRLRSRERKEIHEIGRITLSKPP